MMTKAVRSSHARKRRARSSAASSIQSSTSPRAQRVVQYSPSLGSPRSTPSEPESPAVTAKKKRPAILSGLHPSQDIIGGMPPWELGEMDSATPPVPTQSRYSTRGSMGGYKEGIYDMKYHPMDKATRPKRAAKREQKLKVMSLPEVNPTDEEEECVALPSSSGSDMEDSGDDSDDAPHISTQRSIPVRNGRRSGRQKHHSKPLYNSKKHPMDDLMGSDDDVGRPTKKKKKKRKTYQSIEFDPSPRHTQKRTARCSTDTVYGESPKPIITTHTKEHSARRPRYNEQRSHPKSTAVPATNEDFSTSCSPDLGSPSPIPRSYLQNTSSLAPNELKRPHKFPEDSPQSMKETLQRVMEVVREVKRLEPWIETHLKKSQAVQVHEDSAEVQDAVKIAHSRFPLPHPDDFEKENVRNVTREGSAIINDAFADEYIMGNHASGSTEEDELAHSQVQNHDNVDNRDSADSIHLMPPPSRSRTQTQPHQPHQALPEHPGGTDIQERLASALDKLRTTVPSLQDPPSTGSSPAHSQITLEIMQSSRTPPGYESSQRTVKDTHLTVSQSEALESSQATIPRPYKHDTLDPDDSRHFNNAMALG